MEKNIAGIKTNYHISGTGKDLLLLHGWSVDSSTMLPMQKHFAQHSRVTVLDLPGFGQTERPDSAWDIYQYADFVREFCEEMGLNNPVLLGHSFGGRIAIILGAQGLGRKIVLSDAAGVLPKRPPSYYARVYSYKAAKKVMNLPVLNKHKEQALDLWRKNNPSSDYAKADGIMREIFVKVVNEDLQPLLSQIKAATLLIWGDQDTATPLADGQLMEKLIPDAGLVVFEQAGHYPFLDQPQRFYTIVDYFLEH